MLPRQRLTFLEARVFALFVHGPHTCEMVAEALGIPEPTAMAAIEKLVDMGLLVEARSGPCCPVWKLHGGPG